MSQKQSFIDCILDAPDDPTPRLVYADWLDEHGQELQAWRLREFEKRSKPWSYQINFAPAGYSDAIYSDASRRLKARKGNLFTLGLIASYRAMTFMGVVFWQLLKKKEKSHLLNFVVNKPLWNLSATWYYDRQWIDRELWLPAAILQNPSYLTNVAALFDSIRLPRRFYHTQTPN